MTCRLESTDTDGHIDIREDLTDHRRWQRRDDPRGRRPTEKCMIGVVGTA